LLIIIQCQKNIKLCSATFCFSSIDDLLCCELVVRAQRYQSVQEVWIDSQVFDKLTVIEFSLAPVCTLGKQSLWRMAVPRLGGP
jgi:hypothetical protein